jgi:hypothetical protein
MVQCITLVIYLLNRLVHTTIHKVRLQCKLIGVLPGDEPQKLLLPALISLGNYLGCPDKWPKELVVSRQAKHL